MRSVFLLPVIARASGTVRFSTPLSPPSDPLKSTVSRGFYVVRYRDRVVRWVRTNRG